VEREGVLYAVIVRRDFHASGIHFFTPGEFSQQLAYIARPAGYRIASHFHREAKRDVHRTLEVLLLRRGRLRVDFYSAVQQPIGSRTLGAGDVILLAAGGHGFEMLEECELFEVKQGPYMGDEDTVRFTPAASDGGP
jgi:hypothetical protein